MALGDTLGVDLSSFGTIKTTALSYGLMIILALFISTILLLLLFHFFIRPKTFNIIVEKYKVIDNMDRKFNSATGKTDFTNKPMLMYAGRDRGKLIKKNSRLILLNDGALTYFKKRELTPPPSDYIESTTLGRERINILYRGKQFMEMGYFKFSNHKSIIDANGNILTMPIDLEVIEPDTYTVLTEDLMHEAEKRRLSTPLKDVMFIVSLVVIIICFALLTFYVGSKWDDISKSEQVLSASCSNMEKTCSTYMQLSTELCDKRNEIMKEIENNKQT